MNEEVVNLGNVQQNRAVREIILMHDNYRFQDDSDKGFILSKLSLVWPVITL
jgi:hypothetical protein